MFINKKDYEQIKSDLYIATSNIDRLNAYRIEIEKKVALLSKQVEELSQKLDLLQNVANKQQNNVESVKQTKDNSLEGSGFLRDFSPDEPFFPNEDYKDKRE